MAAGDVGELVRERRTSIGLTQRDLAAASGISIGALRDLEQGRTRCPRWGAVVAIATALGMDRHQRAALADAWSGGSLDRDHEDSAPLGGTGTAGPGVRIGVLGPLTVRRADATADAEPGPARQRAVLGLLALHGPAGVPRDVIADVLWPERTPRSAATQVQAYVSRLRRLLGPAGSDHGPGEPVTLAGGCYRLGGVDLLQGYPAAAEITRRRGDVVLRFARAATARGGQARVLPHLRHLCAREPFNEQAHAHLMTALAATGQQAAAVEAFWQLKRRLDCELGIRPGPQLAAAHLRILRQ